MEVNVVVVNVVVVNDTCRVNTNLISIAEVEEVTSDTVPEETEITTTRRRKRTTSE